MSNGLIQDDQLTSSSYLSPEHAPSKGRLGLQNGKYKSYEISPKLLQLLPTVHQKAQMFEKSCWVDFNVQ